MLMAEMRDKGLPRKHGFAVTSQVVMLMFWEKWGLTRGSPGAGAPLACVGMGTALSLMSPGFPAHKQTPKMNSSSFDWLFVSFALQDLVWGVLGVLNSRRWEVPRGLLSGKSRCRGGNRGTRALQLPKNI